MLVRSTYHLFHHSRDEQFEKKMAEMWANGSSTIEEAVAKFEATIYMGDPKGPFLNPTKKTIDIRYGNQAFVFLGGRNSIIEFLTSADVSGYKFTTGIGDRLGIMTARKKQAFGKNKTALAVSLMPYSQHKNGRLPLTGFGGVQGILPIDTSGKTLTCQQLASIASVLFQRTPVGKATALVGTLSNAGIW